MVRLSADTPFLFFTGKGGVGKTTVASSVALGLADAGRRVLVVSTDPASNLDDVFGIAVGTLPTIVPGVPTLRVMNIDPDAAAAAYRERIVAPYRGVLPEAAVDNMEEQLSGACTVEIAAFNEFTALLANPVIVGQYDHIVFDTAPTGHTLLLLDAAESYHREVARTTGTHIPEAVRQLLPRLRDPRFTKMLLVTLAEATPVHEADRLQRDLRRAGIEPYGWVVNASLAGSGTAHPVLAARARRELPLLHRVSADLAARTWLVPWGAAAPATQPPPALTTSARS
jgi:arsenite-transporting ATPase